MFKMVTRILGVIALTGWMGAANATLIFDFSWDSDNGEIIGEIYGLSDNGESMAATGIVLTSIDGMQVNINVMDVPSWLVEYNDFDVSDGLMEKYEFEAILDSGAIEGRRFSLHSRITDWNFFYDGAINYELRRGEVSFNNRVTVPEPSSVILMLLGLAGLSFARYRKQY
jgi:hypothetical protein